MVLRDRVYYVRALTSALVLGLAIGFNGCKKKEVAEEASEEAPATPAAKTGTPEPKVAVATSPPKAATPAPTPQFAPPGVYFLLTKVSVETSDGVLGLKPGQMLKEVKPGVYNADNIQVTLRPDQVTNDLTVARRVAAQDQQVQAAIQQRLAAAATSGSPAASSAGGQSSIPAPSAAQAAQAAQAQALSANAAARQELKQKRDALAAQINQVAVSLGAASARYGGNWEASSKKSPAVFQLFQQYNNLQRQMTDLDAQINQIH